MPKLKWDEIGARRYETGVSQGVLYVQNSDGTYKNGVVWNGLTGVTESPSGADATDFWADNIKYASVRAAETFGATVEAFTYPDEFEECDGSATLSTYTGIKIGQQSRTPFALCYRTEIGTDSNPNAGHLIHIIYGATASPSQRAYATINDSPDAITFSWEVNTTPIPVTNYKPTAQLIIDSTKVTAAQLTAIENKLYGTDGEGQETGTQPTLLTPSDIITLLSNLS